MLDMQTKQVIKYLASISKNLSTIATGINHLVKETKNQNKLTMAMIQAAEADDNEDIDDDLETEDISAVEADEEEGDIDDND